MLGRLVQYLNRLRAQRLHEPLTAKRLQAINRNEAHTFNNSRHVA